MKDFIAIFVCQDQDTKELKYFNKEFANEKGYYPENNKEDIQELIDSLGCSEDLELYNLKPLDVCEIVTSDGLSLWKER